MKDERLYARFDIGMDEHAKVMLLSDAAFRALIESTLYARRQLTDGFLAGGVVSKKWGDEVPVELSTNHPERPSWVKVEGGWQIRDYGEHQTTTADIQAKREAGRLGGLAKASKGVAPATKSLKQKASTYLAKTETETETETETTPPLGGVRRKPETSLPDEWSPKPSHVKYALERGVDGRHEEGQFRAHAAANDRRQRDWDAAFRAWLGNARPQKATPEARARRTLALATDLLEVEQ